MLWSPRVHCHTCPRNRLDRMLVWQSDLSTYILGVSSRTLRCVPLTWKLDFQGCLLQW